MRLRRGNRIEVRKCTDKVSREFSTVEMLRGMKRRRLSAGRGFKRGEEAWSEEMEAMLKALVMEGDLGMLSAAFERVVVKQRTDSEEALFLEKSACFGVQLHEKADEFRRRLTSQHNSVAWPLTQGLTVEVSDFWLSCCGSDDLLKMFASLGAHVVAAYVSFRSL